MRSVRYYWFFVACPVPFMHYYYRYYFKTESVEYDIRFEGYELCRDKNLFIQFLNRFLFRSSCAYVKCFPWSIASSNIRAIYNIHFCSALLCLALIFTQHHARTHTNIHRMMDQPHNTQLCSKCFMPNFCLKSH